MGGHNGMGNTVMLGDMVVTTGDMVTFPLSALQWGPRRMFTVTREAANQAGSLVALRKACLRDSAWQLQGCAGWGVGGAEKAA